MNKEFNRVCLLIAASGLDERTISEAFRAARAVGPAGVVDAIRHLRRSVINSGEVRVAREEPALQPFDHLDAVVEQVIDLLQNDAGLSAADTAGLLLGVVKSDGRAPRDFPEFRAKEGLRRWLRRLVRMVGPSQLLHYATRIRNDVVHSPVSDWTLRAGREEK
ncbi:hypothetical protein D3C85_826380 [compost metagenome]